jgi:hypothetical protein
VTHQEIKVSGGAVEYTWPTTVSEVNAADISADSVRISLGSYTEPGTWSNGIVERPTASSATIKLLVDNTTTLGYYWVWVSVGDGPETVIRRGARIYVT